MNKIYIYFMVLIISTQAYGQDIGVKFNKNTKKVLNNNSQENLIDKLNQQLSNYLDDYKAKKIVTKNFEMNLLRKNKVFLKEYATKNKLSVIIVLKYKKVSKTIVVNLYINNDKNEEIINYAYVGKSNNELSVVSSILKGLSEVSMIDTKKRRI